jgi:hypothetical protein
LIRKLNAEFRRRWLKVTVTCGAQGLEDMAGLLWAVRDLIRLHGPGPGPSSSRRHILVQRVAGSLYRQHEALGDRSRAILGGNLNRVAAGGSGFWCATESPGGSFESNTIWQRAGLRD